MAQFRVGQMVKVIAGPRAGQVCQVKSGLHRANCSRGAHHMLGDCFCKYGSPLVHDLTIPSGGHSIVCTVPSWLRPYYPPAKWEAGDEWIRRLTKQRELA
ncbi:MAG TPA: KOW motif-containing protein [Polyangiaceae bacterium]